MIVIRILLVSLVEGSGLEMKKREYGRNYNIPCSVPLVKSMKTELGCQQLLGGPFHLVNIVVLASLTFLL